MIKEKCFTEEWLDLFKNQSIHKRIDKNILEKMIYALHLLEHLKIAGLEFTFKGGTSLVLLLNECNRFSIDIDIICNTKKEKLENTLQKVIENSVFTSFELDIRRSYKPGIPKAHYIFAYNSFSNTKYSGKILLDILIEDSIYPETIEKNINTKWIETDLETKITVPTIDAITGDKLTAFAPNTIGIPYLKKGQSFAMEICKQLFDLNSLFEQIKNFEVVAKSYLIFAKQEIEYRKDKYLNIEQVLQDTINTCIIIAKLGNGNSDEKQKFIQLQKGIIAFGTGFLMTGNFRINDAVVATAKICLLATKILVNDYTPIRYYQGDDIKPLIIEDQKWNFLNKLKKQPDKSAFYYWYKTVSLLRKA